MIGAVTINITSSTNITSTSGVTLICASTPASRCGEASIAIITSFRILLKKMSFGDIQKFVRKIIHFDRQHFDLLNKVIVSHQSRNRSRQPDGRRDQGFGDARGNRLDARGVCDTEASKGVHYAPNGSKQSNKWRGARRSRQESKIVLEFGGLHAGCALHRTRNILYAPQLGRKVLSGRRFLLGTRDSDQFLVARPKYLPDRTSFEIPARVM